MLSKNVLFRRERNIDQINLSGELFFVIEKCLNLIQICVWRELLRPTDRIDVVQEFARQQSVIVGSDVDRQLVDQRL